MGYRLGGTRDEGRETGDQSLFHRVTGVLTEFHGEFFGFGFQGAGLNLHETAFCRLWTEDW